MPPHPKAKTAVIKGRALENFKSLAEHHSVRRLQYLKIHHIFGRGDLEPPIEEQTSDDDEEEVQYTE
uniref:Uncharacterized protein n=1 Tax=Romanomermis culicivorax TaxID=13658 RepID=A0A915L0J3_ROMCU